MKKRFSIPVLLFIVLLCTVLLTGCGRSLVITTGFGRGEIFRLGKARGKISELRVYMLDLQKTSEALYGQAIWDSGDSDRMQQAVKDQALSQLTRVKALGQIAIGRNVMLTKEEEARAEEAERAYYAGLSDEEKKYLDLDEKDFLKMFREYALADRMWKSLGDSAEETYEEYYKNTQCDLNIKYWQNVSLKRVEGDPSVPGFAQCYRDAFEGLDFFDNTKSESETEAEDDSQESPDVNAEESEENLTDSGTEDGSENTPEAGTENSGENTPQAGAESGGENTPEAGTENGGENTPEAGAENSGENTPEAGTESGGENKPEAGAESGGEKTQ